MNMDCLLQALGCDMIKETKERFLYDDEFYLEIVREMLADNGFDELGTHIAMRDAKSAFDTAHMLKGIISNCGVTPLMGLISQIVEPLRAGNPQKTDYTALRETYSKLLCQRQRLLGIVNGELPQ